MSDASDCPRSTRSRSRKVFWWAALSPLLPLVLSWIVPLDALTALADFMDRMIWSHLKATHIDDCAPACRFVAYMKIAVPLSWMGSLIFAALRIEPSVTDYRELIKRDRAGEFIREPAAPSQWSAFFKMVGMVLIGFRNRKIEQSIDARNFNVFGSTSFTLCSVLAILGSCAGLSVLLFYTVGIAPTASPYVRYVASALAGIYVTIIMSTIQFTASLVPSAVAMTVFAFRRMMNFAS